MEEPIVFDVWGRVPHEPAARRAAVIDRVAQLRRIDRLLALRVVVRAGDAATLIGERLTWTVASALRREWGDVLGALELFQSGYGPADRDTLQWCLRHEVYFGGVLGCPACSGFIAPLTGA